MRPFQGQDKAAVRSQHSCKKKERKLVLLFVPVVLLDPPKVLGLPPAVFSLCWLFGTVVLVFWAISDLLRTYPATIYRRGGIDVDAYAYHYADQAELDQKRCRGHRARSGEGLDSHRRGTAVAALQRGHSRPSSTV